MMKFVRKKLNKKGFTLVELLLVIAVLGIIAAISIPRVVGSSDAIKVRADEEAAAMVISKIETMIMTNEIIVATSAADTLIEGADVSDAGVDFYYGEVLPLVQSDHYGTSATDVPATVEITIVKDGAVTITVKGTNGTNTEVKSKETVARNF